MDRRICAGESGRAAGALIAIVNCASARRNPTSYDEARSPWALRPLAPPQTNINAVLDGSSMTGPMFVA